MEPAWYRWERRGWMKIKNPNILKAIDDFVSRTDINGWSDWYPRHKHDDNKLKFCHPPKEMVKIYNLLPGDIQSILYIDYGPWETMFNYERHTIIKYIDSVDKQTPIKGGDKKNFFYA